MEVRVDVTDVGSDPPPVRLGGVEGGLAARGDVGGITVGVPGAGGSSLGDEPGVLSIVKRGEVG